MNKIILISLMLIISSCYNVTKYDPKDNNLYKIDTGITNIYLIKGKNKNILVDTSIDGKEAMIEKELKKYNVLPENISLIILTHTHGDHAGNAKYFQEKYKIPIMIGEGDEEMASKGENEKLEPTGILGQIVKPFVNYKYKGFNADVVVKENYSLKEYGIDGKVIRVGGHTKGSVIILLGKNALVGDLIRGGILFNQNPEVHFFHYDKNKSHKVIRDLIKNGYENIYPAHWGELSSKEILKSKVLDK